MRRFYAGLLRAAGAAHAAQGREAAADVAAALAGAQRWLRTAPAAEIRAALPPRARDAWAPPRPPPPPRACQKPGAPQRWLAGGPASRGAGHDRRATVRGQDLEEAPFASPFYWAGFVAIGEG